MLAVRGAGCLVMFVAGCGVFAIFIALDPLLPPGIRVISGAVAVATLGLSWKIFNRRIRNVAARDAERGERPADRFGTKVRSYRGDSYETAVKWFQMDAWLLAPKGYRFLDGSWDPLQRQHPVRYLLLSVISVLTLRRNVGGQEGGTLNVTYELGSTPDRALAALASAFGSLTSLPPGASGDSPG